MQIEYRFAKAEDLNEIEILIQNAVQKMEAENIHQWDEIYPTVEDFASDINEGNLYAGTIDGKIAVVFALNQESDEQYANGKWQFPEKEYFVIHRLCVNPEFQNRGVAKNTMTEIENILLKKNVHAIRLDVFSENPYSLKLYAKCGYTKTGETEWRKGKFYLMEKYF